ncbi:MAG: hypothetical protein DMD39_09675, partial [Gemmatimonadetes bacterium]
MVASWCLRVSKAAKINSIGSTRTEPVWRRSVAHHRATASRAGVPSPSSDPLFGTMIRRVSRREALRELGALFAIPFIRWPERLSDPLAGTIVEYQAGRARGDWSAAQVTKEALDRSHAWNGTLHAIDLWSETAMDEARDSDARARRGRLRGPLDGVPVFAKSIYDMNSLPTTASNAEW